MSYRSKGHARDYHFIFMDIVGSTRLELSLAAQMQHLNFLNTVVREFKASKVKQKSLFEVPTGDGMALGFKDSPEEPLQLAFEIQERLRKYNENKSDPFGLHVRIGLHTGPVEHFMGADGRPSCFGPGIVTAKRVMDFGDADHILASDMMAQNLIRINPKLASMIMRIGVYLAKHEQPVELYNIYNEQMGNPKTPTRLLEQKYGFIQHLRIERQIEILDVRKMQVRHKETRVFKNISEIKLQKWFQQITLDVPLSMNELQLHAIDEYGKEIPIEFIVDTPERKDYHVVFESTIDPGQIYTYILYYNAIESDRYLEYELVGETGLFEFALVCPQYIRPSSLRVYEVDQATGKKSLLAELGTPELNHKNVIRWALDRPRKNTILRFEW